MYEGLWCQQASTRSQQQSCQLPRLRICTGVLPPPKTTCSLLCCTCISAGKLKARALTRSLNSLSLRSLPLLASGRAGAALGFASAPAACSKISPSTYMGTSLSRLSALTALRKPNLSATQFLRSVTWTQRSPSPLVWARHSTPVSQVSNKPATSKHVCCPCGSPGSTGARTVKPAGADAARLPGAGRLPGSCRGALLAQDRRQQALRGALRRAEVILLASRGRCLARSLQQLERLARGRHLARMAGN